MAFSENRKPTFRGHAVAGGGISAAPVLVVHIGQVRPLVNIFLELVSSVKIAGLLCGRLARLVSCGTKPPTMTAPSSKSLASLREVIRTVFPALEASRFSLLTEGFDSVAVDVDDRLIFKFPRSAAAERRLRMEARLLEAVRSAVTLPVPVVTLHEGPPLFSCHEKLKGEHLLPTDYEKLPDAARCQLDADMTGFFAELHVLDQQTMKEASAWPVEEWLPPNEILRQAWPLLPAELRPYAERTVTAYAQLPPDPLGTVYGFFDGHGWNMAFDHAAQRINGIYDFGDSGFGPLHREFVQPSLIGRDCARRIMDEYETLTGRRLDCERVAIMSGVLRISELGGFASDPPRIPAARDAVAEWAADPHEA
jgi:hypothetical protein